MLAKVSLSLAMAHEPGLLVLDEPTSGLDPLVRREFLESMVDVTSEGRTVLLSSHQIGEVERVADVVAILRNGELVACEQLDDLKNNVSEVTLTLAEPGARLPNVPGRVLREESSDRQTRLLVRDLDDQHLGRGPRGPGGGVAGCTASDAGRNLCRLHAVARHEARTAGGRRRSCIRSGW